ncbi:tRNA (adenosine(37)-N6)-threonylcarbamoyltransferase complex transferase subunit TsaD [Sneathiella sp. P13V-1]|uniref:tRNA (adenosine(37)-N6)-threonylcarbamoyltransferase complex transferase subunit TsaD n=1 Tax=Sneathiella sp. P13V-1 TaxID=2697366 RepID=UPI00187BB1B9|nr:tRNA (adenosine(37)-N6)-threonylcarbamoyltransferase complex transferase subunit TsaD [Sneathiella sp. P13V-1]MBE7636246.1 tRNA (adenosine(37)-N6)-threonylcarbamoyltransferase complex transferase subunit TsaD [Sneathiella sp. P13V-1]
MIVLGLESSCDETAAAVVTADGRILSNVVLSQIEEHAPFGGVVPEIAARAHVTQMDQIVDRAMKEAGIGFDELDGVAATAGPGLIGGVLVGLMTAKSIAAVADIPLVGVNHLEGHALTVRMTDGIAFPYLLLLVSGGHSQILVVEGVGKYRRLGTTIDDAVGEAFDKTAKMMGLGFPGGPAVEKAAASGDGTRFKLPRPMKGKPGCDFSFSGLKTAVRQALADLGDDVTDQDKADLAASFQVAAVDALLSRVKQALKIYKADYPDAKNMVIAGGVAANKHLRAELDIMMQKHKLELVVPPPALCTDNGAMIAWAGMERLKRNETDTLDLAAKARWPLDPDAEPAPFAGYKA